MTLVFPDGTPVENPRRILNALTRRSLTAFVQKSFSTLNPGATYLHNWHIDVLCHELEKCLTGETKRLIVTLPPRHLKSICASVAFPAWVLGKAPSKKIICASYSNDLSRQLSGQFRTVVQADWYRNLFPRMRIKKGHNTEAEIGTTQNGSRFATSVDGTLTGRGGDILIIDDPIKAGGVLSPTERTRVNDWYDQTLYSRLDNRKDGIIIIVMQRLHVNDLVGHVLEKENWTVVNMPVIAVEPTIHHLGVGQTHERHPGDLLHADRMGHKEIDDVRRNLAPFTYEAQYQQQPVPPGGYLIKREWLHRYEPDALPERFDDIVQSWDCASSLSEKADYSVGLTFGIKDHQAYLIDVVRDRLDFPHLKRKVIDHYDKHKASVLIIENANSGTALWQELRQDGRIRPISWKPKVNKETRAEGVTSFIEGGRVLFPEKADWIDDFVNELLSFPQATHDDQVDALTQFLDWFRQHIWRNTPQKRLTTRERPRGNIRRRN